MESVDFLAMCTCIYSPSRERKRLFGCCFNPRPGFRVGKISQCACAFLDESLAWVLRKSLFYECTTSACNSPLLKPFYGGLQGRFPCFAPISSHSPQKSSNIRAIYHPCLIDLDLLFDGDIDLSRHSFNNYFVPLVVLLDRLTYLYSSVHS